MGLHDMYLIHNGANDITSDVINVIASKGLDTTAGTLQLQFKANDTWNGFFTESDKIEAYFKNGWIDTANPSTDDLIISANVKDLVYNALDGTEILTVDCIDRTAIFNNQLLGKSFRETTGYYVAKSADDGGNENNSIVHWIVNQINYANRENANWEDIKMGTIDTTSLPEDMSGVEYAVAYKTYGEVLKELAQGRYTNGEIYYFNIDSQNKFNWIRKAANASGTIAEGTDKITAYKISKEVYDIVNAAVFNAGVDLDGQGIWWYAINEVSASDIGFKWAFYSDVRLSDNWIDSIYEVDSTGYGSGSTWTDSTASWTPDEHIDSYLVVNGATRGFKILDNDSTTLTVAGEPNFGDSSNKVGYKIYNGGNAQYRTDVKNAAKSQVTDMLRATAKLRYKGTISLKGTNSIVAGQVWNTEIDNLSWSSSAPKKLRVTDVDHTISPGGWTTQISLKEDEGTEGVAV